MTWSGPAFWLRVASVLTLLFAAGHAMGAADSWSPAGDTDVLRAMRAFEFEVMGVTRTYWHFYYGFGIYTVVLWRFIFPMPALFSLLITLSLSLAFGAARRLDASESGGARRSYSSSG